MQKIKQVKIHHKLSSARSKSKYNLPIRRISDNKIATRWEYQDNNTIVLWFNHKTVVYPLYKVEIYCKKTWLNLKAFQKIMQNLFNEGNL